jgi:S-DNA-T family DNA segregation ATPase FtsK/SpoIIIE
MAKIYISKEDEGIFDKILSKQGLGIPKHPKWMALRIALAISLHIDTEPDEQLDEDARGSGYDLRQVTGLGQEREETEVAGRGRQKDYTDAFRALLSIYHGKDLFTDDDLFRRLLQRHIRRGFREIRTSWRESHDFHEYLYQELFADAGFRDSDDADSLEARVVDALAEIGVRADIQNRLYGPRLTRLLCYLPDVHDLDRLRKGTEKVSFSLGLRDQGVFMQRTDAPKIVALDVPRPPETWQRFTGADLRRWMENPLTEMKLPVWPGVDVLGNPYVLDLARAPHLLVAGTTGSGKSVCLHALLIAMVSQRRPEELQVCLIDPKKVEFRHYVRLPHLWNGRVASEPQDIMETLQKLTMEMEKRETQLAGMGAGDIAEIEAKGMQAPPRIVVFVEELADLLMQLRSAETPLVRLAQKARAVGIHLVVATQRPDAETFSGMLRSNIPTRIALTVQKSSESKIILDEVGAERLSGAGDMLVKPIGGEVVRVHGVYVGPDDIALCLKATGKI